MGFHLAVAAANSNQATARSRSLPEAAAELIFRKELAVEMMENTIGVTDVPRQLPSRRVNAAMLGHENIRPGLLLLAPATAKLVNSRRLRRCTAKSSVPRAKRGAGPIAHVV